MRPHHQKMTSKSPMYIYATEMVSCYYSILDLKDKRILSIVGSGDQIINAYFFGAKEVVGFDINKYAFFMLDLKLSAINSLTYKEFLKFFGTNMGNGNFNFSLYDKLKYKLSKRTKVFFDMLYKEFQNNGGKIIKSEYFRERYMIKTSTSLINYYLKNEKNYLKCREILKNKKVKFIELDINDISTNKKLKNKFDIINLSNVLNYFTGTTKEKSKIKVLCDITRKISKKLSNKGVFFYYSYSPIVYKNSGRQIPPASRRDVIREIKKINNFQVSTKSFEGIFLSTFDKINVFKI